MVFGIGLRAADLYETASHRQNFHLVVAQHFGGVKLPVVPGSLDELYHEHAQALPDGANAVPRAQVVLPLPGPV